MSRQTQQPSEIKLRKHLIADSLFQSVHTQFFNVPDLRAKDDIKISMPDAPMAGSAMFSLKDPSLLAFDQRRVNRDSNLHTIYKINTIPSDTQMHTILDPVDPETLTGRLSKFLSGNCKEAGCLNECNSSKGIIF